MSNIINENNSGRQTEENSSTVLTNEEEVNSKEQPYKTNIHFNELFLQPNSEERHNLAKYLRTISMSESFVINLNELLKTIYYDEYIVEKEFYQKATLYKDLEGDFELNKNNDIIITISKKTDPYSDMILFLCLFLNRGSYIDIKYKPEDNILNYIIKYKKKQYKIKNEIGLNEKPGHLSLAKLASCKPQVITYLCHFNCAKFIIDLDFLGDIPKCMQHCFFSGVVPQTKSYESMLYYCYLFTILWFRKIMDYPKNDIDKEKIEDYVRTCHSGYLDNIERLIILHSLKLVDNGVPSKALKVISLKSKLIWNNLDLFDKNKKIFLILLKNVPDWLSFKQKTKWIRNHSKWDFDIEEENLTLKKSKSNILLSDNLQTNIKYHSDYELSREEIMRDQI